MKIKKQPINNQADRKYFILDLESKLTPVFDYDFGPEEKYLEILTKSECYSINHSDHEKQASVECLMAKIGFSWDYLTEPGHMRQKPMATVMLEAIEKYVWSVANEFCSNNDIALHRISGGELYDPEYPQLQRQIAVIKQNLIYGTNQYSVLANDKSLVLRYSACTQKLLTAKEANLKYSDLPTGIFEVSKSYRFEKDDELQLCKRVRSFRLPELHIINENLSSSLEKSVIVHQQIDKCISDFGQSYELFCSVPYDFFESNFPFLEKLVALIGRPLLLAIYDEGANCGNGIKIDVEYKTFDSQLVPMELATFQVDDGTSAFSFDIKHQTSAGSFAPVSTIHAVLFSSLERAAYFFIDQCIRLDDKLNYQGLPFWLAPIQVRIVSGSESIIEAKKLANKLSTLNIRADIDDCELAYSSELNLLDLKIIPFTVNIKRLAGNVIEYIIEDNFDVFESKCVGIEEFLFKVEALVDKNISVQRYSPLQLSKRIA